ncbi:uncharacterized protein LOC109794245 [Cajanus cajan]|uniref:uncharacterized protein LOC109794245 n=1 Tax=Cajanus cajan TaxID=3821 RepID=UPI00098DA024|nr:uncharacterized protein LOC109794245 [Cajanus cajan]
MRQQHAVGLENIHTRHEADLTALRAENKRIRAQLPWCPSDQPPQPSNQNEEEGHSVSQPPTAPRAATHRSTIYRSHVPTNRSNHEVSNAPAQAPGYRASIRRHPFVDDIMETPFLLDGRFFLTSLKGLALTWYTQLLAGSVDNFDTLVTRFTTHYATSRPHHIMLAALASLRQGNDEPLRAFMERFASISVKIRNLNPEVTLHAMLMALKPRPFVDNLWYIQIKEHTAFHDQVRGKSQAKPDHDHKDKVKVTNDSQFKKAARANKGGSYNSADKSKHCRYHRNYGLTTEECCTFRDRIEELVQGGHLGQAVQAEVNQDIGSAPLQGVINTITSGFAGGGSSSSARKRHLQSINNVHTDTSAPHRNTPAITFIDDDYTDVCPNQDDPMVIAVEVANWEVHKALIDQGSSIDVLYWPTFLRLDIPYSLIQPHTEPLVNFTGE